MKRTSSIMERRAYMLNTANFDNPTDVWRPYPTNPTNIRIYFIFLETIIIGLHFATGSKLSICVEIFYGWLRKNNLFLSEWRFGFSRSSKVIDFGTNRKRVCDFLLVRHNNLGSILHRFGDIPALYVLLTPPVFHPNFGVFPLHQIAFVGVSPSRNFKLISHEIIFEVFQPMWSRYLNVTDERHRRDTMYNLITALCVASHGKT